MAHQYWFSWIIDSNEHFLAKSKTGITAQLEVEAKELQKKEQKKKEKENIEEDSDRDTDGEEKKADVSLRLYPWKLKKNG